MIILNCSTHDDQCNSVPALDSKFAFPRVRAAAPRERRNRPAAATTEGKEGKQVDAG